MFSTPAWARELAAKMGPITYVAPGREGWVLRPQADGSWRAESMLWGFPRPWNKAVNNARGDKLSQPMWNSAWTERRCLVPALRYFEWHGEKGKKVRCAVAPRWDSAEPRWFLMGGLWEDTAVGKAYTIITTDACESIAWLHHRMPLLLEPQDAETFSRSAIPPLHLVRPFQGALSVENPGEQGKQLELFGGR